MSKPNGYLNIDEVAERIGRTVMTARRWCVKGMFEGAYKDGTFRQSPWYVPESSVDAYLDEIRPKTLSK